MMTIGTLALTGFPFTAGYYSKDAIIEAAYASSRPGAFYAYAMATIVAGLTSFYSWRLVFMTFFGTARWEGAAAHADDHGVTAHEGAKAHLEPTNDPHSTDDAHGHKLDPHESPLVMTIPLVVLGVGALFAGFVFRSVFIGGGYDGFWKGALFAGPDNHILHEMHEVPEAVGIITLALVLIGFLVALYGYVLRPAAPARWAATNPILYRFLVKKWYFDEIYGFVFVRGAFGLGRLFWHGGDQNIIDRLGPDGVSARVVDVTNRVVRLQTGYIYHYAFAMLIGVAAIITWYVVGGLS